MYFNHLLQNKGYVAPGGTLVLIIKEGLLKRDTEIIGQMDPFVKIEFDGKTFKTPVK